MGDNSMQPSMLFFNNVYHENLPTFVQPIEDKYLCAYCKHMLRPPIRQTGCGHRICDGCIDDMFETTGVTQCPGNEEDCQILKKNELNPDPATNKELMRLEVYCPNIDKGCNVKVRWSKLPNHEATCQFRKQKCPNNGCQEMYYASNLKQHLEHCDFAVADCDICYSKVLRSDMKNGHKSECIAKPRKCVYSVLGCTYEAAPDKHNEHLISCIQNHSRLIVSVIEQHKSDRNEAQRKIVEIQQLLSSLELTIGSLQNHSKHQKVIQAIQTSIANLNNDFGVVKRQVDELATASQFQETNDQVQCIKQITSSHESRLGHLERNSSRGSDNSDINQKLDRLERTIAMHDIRGAESDLRFRLLETAAFDGRLIWRIPDYSRRKQDAVDGRTVSLYSQPFYSSYYGYKMCARVYLNGDGLGKGSHLSLFFVIMKGEYDPLQTWPFRQKVTLSLLDQSGNRKHICDTFRPDPTSTSFRKPTGEMNVASGSPMFATQSQVESPGFLIDDTLFIAVSVDKTDILNPWA